MPVAGDWRRGCWGVALQPRASRVSKVGVAVSKGQEARTEKKKTLDAVSRDVLARSRDLFQNPLVSLSLSLCSNLIPFCLICLPPFDSSLLVATVACLRPLKARLEQQRGTAHSHGQQTAPRTQLP
jgi:hypothetical protein